VKIIIPVSGGFESGFLLHKALLEGHEVFPVEFDDGDMEHIENHTARSLVDYLFKKHCHPMTSLRIPERKHLKVQYPLELLHQSHDGSMKDMTYWSGFKTLFYATTLAFGGAIGADEIQFGVSKGNDRFQEGSPEMAYKFRDTWVLLYPELKIPKITFPLMGRKKYQVLLEAAGLGFPFEKTWSCFGDGPEPCGECLGCKHRKESFEEAGLRDYSR
jgi:7-cyano-7-deazaguanine synthase